MELRKKLLSVASLAFAAALSTGLVVVGASANETNWENFAVSAVSIRMDNPATEKVDSGIRFQVNCPVDYSASESVNAYTTLTFTSAAEGTVKQYTIDVPAQVWRDATGWNTVLLDIPASDYVTEITAQAFVAVDENTTYQTVAKTTSIAKTAATLMANGETREEVTKYAANAVNAIELPATATIAYVGETTKLTATTDPAGFDVVFASSNTDVATVAADGTVTATGIGKVNITATMSGVTATCEVTVGDAWAKANNVTSYGATMNAKQAVVLQKSVAKNGEWWHDQVDELQASYVALNGNYGVGDFVAFDFTGNNMPIVTLAAKNVTKDWRNVDITNSFAVKDATDGGFVVMNGRSGHPGESDYHSDAHNKRIASFGPYKFQNLDDIASGKQARTSTASNVGVGFAELVGSTDKFRMIVGIESFTTTEVKIGVVVVNLTKSAQPVFNTMTLNISNCGLNETFEGSIILHGRMGMETKLDKVYPVFENTNKGQVRDDIANMLPEWAQNAGITAYGATVNADQSVSLKTGTGVWWPDQSGSLDLGYIAFNGKYGVGDFVVVDFTGNNMPYVTLAASKVTNDYRNVTRTENPTTWSAADKTETGFVVANGYFGGGGESNYHNISFNKRINAFGPYKQQTFEGSSVDQAWASAALETGVGRIELIGSTDQYRLIVGIESFTTTEVKIGVVVVNLTKKTQPAFNTITLNISNCGLNETFEGSIILHGRRGMETKLDKVYPIYENTDKGTVKWSIPGSNF